MSDIAASERRLSAALDRIDQILEAGIRPAAAPVPTDDAQIQDLVSENNRLAAELAALREDRQGPVEAQLAEARTRLAAAADEAVRLVTANDDLIASNRELMQAVDHDDGGDTLRQALEAEIGALRAARAAEIAQMSDIMVELERLLAQQNAPHQAAADDSVSPESTGDGGGVPEAGDAPKNEGL
ncbi:hypothetical protein [Paracoccus homiensis]|uniref:hypothetical protein n=1 Tax=Paracoccus homiensis TaxID=364199 RepID=UPI00398D1B15